jgi:ABC-2 type transport system ATP-binding protein
VRETFAIEAEGLSKTFKGGVKALDGFTLRVAAGTVLGLLGPNGAGKTTAVRILTTILKPDSGSARILGYDVVHEARRVRRVIGLAGQYAAVDGNLTGRENLEMIGRLSRLSPAEARRRAAELLEQFGLGPAANRVVKGYSGGMRRRLDLAAALVARPPVLFLDEPTTGLDPYSRSELWAAIKDLVGKGTTLLLTTQYLEEADRLADRIAVMDKGRVVAEGTPGELKARLGERVLELSCPTFEAAQRAASVAEELGMPFRIEGSKVEIVLDHAARSLSSVVSRLESSAAEIESIALHEPTLDDVFFALTKRQP